MQRGLALCNEREPLHNCINLLPHDDIGIVKLRDGERVFANVSLRECVVARCRREVVFVCSMR